MQVSQDTKYLICLCLHGDDEQIISQLKCPLMSCFKTTAMMKDQKVLQFTNTANMHLKIKISA